MEPNLILNLFCDQAWLWTSNPPASSFWVLRLQTWAITPSLGYAAVWSHRLQHVRLSISWATPLDPEKTLFQLIDFSPRLLGFWACGEPACYGGDDVGEDRHPPHGGWGGKEKRLCSLLQGTCLWPAHLPLDFCLFLFLLSLNSIKLGPSLQQCLLGDSRSKL